MLKFHKFLRDHIGSSLSFTRKTTGLKKIKAKVIDYVIEKSL